MQRRPDPRLLYYSRDHQQLLQTFFKLVIFSKLEQLNFELMMCAEEM